MFFCCEADATRALGIDLGQLGCIAHPCPVPDRPLAAWIIQTRCQSPPCALQQAPAPAAAAAETAAAAAAAAAVDRTHSRPLLPATPATTLDKHPTTSSQWTPTCSRSCGGSLSATSAKQRTRCQTGAAAWRWRRITVLSPQLQLLASLAGHEGGTTSLCWGRGGVLVSAGEDGAAAFWSCSSSDGSGGVGGRCLARLQCEGVNADK